MEPRIERIKGGWSARAERWAVHAETREQAVKLFREAEERHRELDAVRPVDDRK